MIKSCSVEGCRCKHYAKGLCSKHYQRVLRAKRPKPVVPSLPHEQWKMLPDDACFLVSSYGRVKRVFSNGKERLLRQRLNKYGYRVVCLYADRMMKTCTVHRLVARTFLENPKGLPQVNHIDGDKTNNRVENLEWCDASRNIRHRIYQLGIPPVRPCKQVLCIETGEIFPSLREACRQQGLLHGNLSAVLHNAPTHHTAGGYHWKFIKQEK